MKQGSLGAAMRHNLAGLGEGGDTFFLTKGGRGLKEVWPKKPFLASRPGTLVKGKEFYLQPMPDPRFRGYLTGILTKVVYCFLFVCLFCFGFFFKFSILRERTCLLAGEGQRERIPSRQALCCQSGA